MRRPRSDGPPQPSGRSQNLSEKEHLPDGGGIFDDTITSHLDDTKSDVVNIGYGMENGKGRMYEDDYDLHAETEPLEVYPDPYQQLSHHDQRSGHFPQSVLHHKESRQPLNGLDLKQQQNGYVAASKSIAGRFEGRPAAAGHEWKQDIAHRSSPRRDPNGASYSDDRDDLIQEQSMGYKDEDSYGSGESNIDSDLPTQRGRDDRQTQEGGDGFETRPDGADLTDSPPCTTARDEIERALNARLAVPNRGAPDYDDEKLKSMTYASLKEEPWDAKSSGRAVKKKRANSNQNQDSEYSFDEIMEFTVNESRPEVQVQTFENMSIEEFDQAGEFFVGKFGELMKEITQARKKKRKLVSDFEREIEAHEKAVRGECEGLDKQFRDMRAGGEGVLRGKV